MQGGFSVIVRACQPSQYIRGLDGGLPFSQPVQSDELAGAVTGDELGRFRQ